ncbi:MAG: ABC transporter permease [Lysobacterales bacterium]
MNDLRLALRQLLAQPAFALIAILTLGLGIGANIAVYTVINAVLLNPLPYPQADGLVFIGQTREGREGTIPVAYPDFLEWRAQAEQFSELTWMNSAAMSLSGAQEPANVRVAMGTADLWPMLRTAPALGRTYTAAEDRPGAAPVAVLSHGLWQRQFGAAPDVLGRSILLNQKAYTVIGVMPPAFKFWAGDLWVPAGLDADSDLLRGRVIRNDFWVVGRLAPGATPDSASEELKQISQRLAQAFPDTNQGTAAEVTRLSDTVGGNLRATLTVLLLAVVCVLLIACVNVANLLLNRAAARERDYSVRLALGITPRRLLRSLLIENLPLALLGTLAGLLFAYGGLQALLGILPANIVPSESRIEINGPVLGFALLLAFASTLAFGMLVGFSRSMKLNPEALRKSGAGGTPRQQGLRGAMVVAEVALALTLLICAGLLVQGLQQMQQREPGFATDHLLVLPVALSETRYPSGTASTQFYEQLVAKASALPGVSQAAASFNLPMMWGSGIPLVAEGQSFNSLDELPIVQMHLTLGDVIGTLGLQLVQGRALDERDRRGSAPVIVINESAARLFSKDASPLGKRVLVGLPDNLMRPGLLPAGVDQFWWSEVVGVVKDVRHFGLTADPPPAVYMPVAQSWDATMFRNSMHLVMRTEVEPMTLASATREALWSLDRDQPADGLTSMDQVVYQTLGQVRFNTVLLGCFALLALLLAAIGIYGVVAWHVTQRTREISLRMAIGAPPRTLARAELRRGLRLVLIGIGAGLLLALGAGRLLAALLEGIDGFSLALYLGVPLLLLAIAALASWWPAHRAMRIDPMLSLRAE